MIPVFSQSLSETQGYCPFQNHFVSFSHGTRTSKEGEKFEKEKFSAFFFFVFLFLHC